MSNENTLLARMTIDLKRNRFRFDRQTLDNLGNPTFLQFLINPEELFVAVLGIDEIRASETTIIVKLKNYCGSTEFCCSPLVYRLVEIFGKLDFQYSYYLLGEIDKTNHVAYFSLNTLKKFDRKQIDDRKTVRAT